MRPFIICAALAVGIAGFTASALHDDMPAAHGSRWSLIYVIEDNEYIADRGMSLSDCVEASTLMKGRAPVVYCERESV